MKSKVAISLIFLLSFFQSPAQHAFEWLIGTWKLQGKDIYEVWKSGGDGNLYGESFKVRNSDSLLLEKITLTYSKGYYHYMPEVAENKAPVDFRITRYDNKSFVAENPEHDFPKLIRYTIVRKENGDLIEAAIEGNGKVILYTFENVR